jgi:glycerol uptake facilitator-like aquaporin
MIEYVLEIVGTFVFLGTILMYASKPVAGPAIIGLALAASLFLSGGHLNPAVSIMFFLKDKFALNHLLMLVGSQMLGMAGALTFFG